jgi:hypothetical protein
MMSPNEYRRLHDTAAACLRDPAFAAFIIEIQAADEDELVRAVDIFEQVRAELIASGELVS